MKNSQLRRDYLPNLTEYLACCTGIYQKFAQNLPHAFYALEVFQWPIADYALMEVQIKERHKYTDMLTVHLTWQKHSNWLLDLTIHLRLYHDMRLAEVVGYTVNEQQVNLQVRDESNHKVSYPIEKKQIHRLLFEWLSLSD